MKSWKEFDIFKHVDLEDSFVLGWKILDETFFIDLDVSLWPGHEDYEPPKKDEFTCYKRGRLIFRSPQNVEGLLDINDVRPTIGPENDPDYEIIEGFEIEGNTFHISGDFGDVRLNAVEWDFKIAKKI